jgi:hypothetical protein
MNGAAAHQPVEGGVAYSLFCCYYLRYSPLTSRSKAVVPLLREVGSASLCPRSLPGSIASLTRFLSSLFSGKRPSSAREKSTSSPSLVSRVTSKMPSPDGCNVSGVVFVLRALCRAARAALPGVEARPVP